MFFNISEYLGAFFFVGFLVFLLTLFNPRIGLGLLIFAVILSPEMKFSNKYLRIDDILLIVILLGWIANMATKGKGFVSTKLNLIIVLYLLINLISMVNSFVFGNFSPSYQSFRPFDYSILTFLKKLEYFCLFFATANSIKNVRQIKAFVIMLLLASFIADIYAVYQTTATPLVRVTAPFDPEANTFGQYLMLHILILTAFLFSKMPLPQKLPLLFLLLLSIYGFTFTYSRGSYLALLIALAFLGIVWNKKILFMLYIILFLASAIFPSKVIERVQSGFNEIQQYREGNRDVGGNSFVVRVNSFQEGFKVAMENPLLGAGLGLITLSQIESQFPREAYEIGFVGLFIFLWLLYEIFKLCFISARKFENSYLKALSYGTLAALVGYIISGFSAVPFTTIRTAEPFWIFVALVVVANNLTHYHKIDKLNFTSPENIKGRTYSFVKTTKTL